MCMYIYTYMKLERKLTGTEYVEFHMQCKPLSDDESLMSTINSIRTPNILIHVHVILNSCKLIRQRLMYELHVLIFLHCIVYYRLLMQLIYMYVILGSEGTWSM